MLALSLVRGTVTFGGAQPEGAVLTLRYKTFVMQTAGAASVSDPAFGISVPDPAVIVDNNPLSNNVPPRSITDPRVRTIGSVPGPSLRQEVLRRAAVVADAARPGV